MSTLEKAGRIAFREEGSLWVAYYADLETMEGALYLGSVQLKLVRDSDERKSRFMELMRDGVSAILLEQGGERPVWPEQPHVAPEHERGVAVPNPYLK